MRFIPDLKAVARQMMSLILKHPLKFPLFVLEFNSSLNRKGSKKSRFVEQEKAYIWKISGGIAKKQIRQAWFRRATIPFLTYKVPEKRHEGKNVHQWPWNIISLLPFFCRRLRLCTILGMNGKREEKKRSTNQLQSIPIRELCVCTHKHNEASRKNIPSSTHTNDAQRILPFFPSFALSCLVSGWSCCCCLLRILESFVLSKCEALQPSL